MFDMMLLSSAVRGDERLEIEVLELSPSQNLTVLYQCCVVSVVLALTPWRCADTHLSFIACALCGYAFLDHAHLNPKEHLHLNY